MPTSLLDVIRAVEEDLFAERKRLAEALDTIAVAKARIKKAERLLNELHDLAGVGPALRVTPGPIPVTTHPKPGGILVLDENGEPIKTPAEPEKLESPRGKFACPECGKTFLTGQGLGSHRSRIHDVAGTSARTLARLATKGESR